MIKKAVIAVAGFGTRRLPITRSIEKCMLPIGNRPVIDYVVQSCIDSGIQEFAFVVSPNSSQLQEYYSDNQRLQNFLQKSNQEELLKLTRVPKGVSFRYIIQPDGVGYGTTVPLALCYKFIGNDQKFLYLSGDDFLWNKQSGEFDDLKNLIKVARQDKLPALLVKETVVSQSDKSYGQVIVKNRLCQRINEAVRLGIGEKLNSNTSKYVLNQKLLKIALSQIKSKKYLNNAEFKFTDVINEYVLSGEYLVCVKAKGEYLDVGDQQAWLAANSQVIGI